MHHVLQTCRTLWCCALAHFCSRGLAFAAGTGGICAAASLSAQPLQNLPAAGTALEEAVHRLPDRAANSHCKRSGVGA